MSATQPFDLTGKVAVITGASRGIGREIAVAYARAGADVVLASRKQPDLDAVADEVAALGDGAGRALALACHTGSDEQVAALVAAAVERFGGVDVLVNNAATNPHFGPLLTAEESHWDKTFDVNVKGYVRLIRACVPSMRERGGGAIVNVASGAGLAGSAAIAAYGASKAAVLRLTESLSAEVKGRGVRVNAVLPGTIDTAANRAAMPDADTSKWVAPDAIADVILFLASPAARAIHGVSLPVFGLG